MANFHLISPTSSLSKNNASSSSSSSSSSSLSGSLPAVETTHRRHHLRSTSLLLVRQPLRPAIMRCSQYSREAVDLDWSNRLPEWRYLYMRLSGTRSPEEEIPAILLRWESEQNRKLAKWEIHRICKNFRKKNRYKHALALSQWMASREKQFRFNSSDAAIHLDLISKVRGAYNAEEYFEGLPLSFRDKRTYCALLNAYCKAKMKDKANATLEAMKNNNHVTDPLGYNVMMAMYKDLEEYEKVISTIKEMREINMRLDRYSFNLWITACAALGDMEEMERALKVLRVENIANVDWSTYCTLATVHISLGKVEKAKKYIKEAESWLTGKSSESFGYLLGLYSSVGKKEEVYKVWQWYNSSFHKIPNAGYRIMLSALLKLDDVEGAESIYGEWLRQTTRFDPSVCNVLLVHYEKHGQVAKAECCLKEMIDRGGVPSPISCEILARAYINKKRTSQALSYLKKAKGSTVKLPKRWRPKPETVAEFLVLCGEKNDEASVESLVEFLRKLKCLDDEEYRHLISVHAEAALQRDMGGVQE